MTQKSKIIICLKLIVTPLLLLVIFFGIGLGWMGFGIIIIVSIYRITTSNMKWVTWIKSNTILAGSLSIVSLIAAAVLIRTFVFELYEIPSESMNNTLLVGDELLVSKLSYGPALPQSEFELPIINSIFYLQKGTKKVNYHHWEYLRLSGFSKIQRSDIIVFFKGKNRNEPYIKRCIGLPGDSILIRNGDVSIGDSYKEPKGVRQPYRLKIKKVKPLIRLLDSLGIVFYRHELDEGLQADFIFTNAELSSIMSRDCIDSIVIHYPNKIPAYPLHKSFNWTTDNMGPLAVPYKGMRIPMTIKNFILYRPLFSLYENVAISEISGKFYLQGEELKAYTFKKDYFFMLGDNRLNSQDSRSWGFVPEENIVGKAICILYSNSDSGFKWKRMLKFLF